MKIDQPFRRVARSPTFVARVGRNSCLDGNKRHRGPDGLAKDQVRPRVVDRLTDTLASITAIAALTALAVVRSAHVPGSSVLVHYLLVIVWTAILCGTRVAGVIAVLGAAVYDYLFAPPLYPSKTPIPGT
jgi:K+-sensing histidine kinase KdpD